MRRVFSIALILMMCFSTISQGSELDTTEEYANVQIEVNGEVVVFENPPVIRENRTVAPLRAVFETLGLEVGWNNSDKSITGTLDGISIWLQLNNSVAIVNGKEVKLDVPAFAIDGRTYVPVRFLGESTGCEVGWVSESRTVTINSPIVDKNIYTQSYLQSLVDTTECAEDVLTFRSGANPRRNGLLKLEGKYFDIYYPDDDKSKETIDLVKPHMDKAYMMLADMYGVQATVEVHLILEEDALNLREGNIRQEERVTYVWIEEFNDGEAGINNIAEFIHEINHNFFADPRVNGSATNEMWINEAHAKMVASIYLYHTELLDEVDMWSFYSPINTTDYPLLSIEEADNYLRKERAWGRADGELKRAQITGMYLWNYVYNANSLEEFKTIIRDLGNSSVITALEKTLGKSIVEVNEDMLLSK